MSLSQENTFNMSDDNKQNICPQINVLPVPYHEKFKLNRPKSNFIVPTSVGYSFVPLQKKQDQQPRPVSPLFMPWQQSFLNNPVLPVPQPNHLLPVALPNKTNQESSHYTDISLSRVTRQLDYNILTENNDDISNNNFNNSSKYKIELDEAKKELDRLHDKYEAEKNKRQGELDYYINVANNNRKDYLGLEAIYRETLKENQRLETQLSNLTAKQAEQKETKISLTQISTYLSTIEQLKNRVSELEVALTQSNKKREAYQEQIKNLKQESRKQSEGLKQALVTAQTQANRLKSVIQQTEKETESQKLILGLQLTKLEATNQRCLKEINLLELQCKRYKEQSVSLKENMAKLQNQHAKSDLEQKNIQLTKENAYLREQRDRLENKLLESQDSYLRLLRKATTVEPSMTPTMPRDHSLKRVPTPPPAPSRSPIITEPKSSPILGGGIVPRKSLTILEKKPYISEFESRPSLDRVNHSSSTNNLVRQRQEHQRIIVQQRERAGNSMLKRGSVLYKLIPY